MKVPKSPYNAYNQLKKARLVTKKNVDEEALAYFETALNRAYPKDDDEFTLYFFIRGLYYENKYKFISFIRNTRFECLVLWTEWRNIVDFLRLRGVVNIKWQPSSKNFKVTKYKTMRETSIDQDYKAPEPSVTKAPEPSVTKAPEPSVTKAPEHKNVKKWADIVSSDEDVVSSTDSKV